MDKKSIIKLAKKDFEQAWIESGKHVTKPHHDQEYPRLRYNTGKSHILCDTISQIRQAYLQLGFQETYNPVFIDEEDVYRQFGPEAAAVLDRCFYLAGLPRPDIGIGADKIEKIKKLGVNINDDKIQNLQDIFRGYKKGTIDGDDLVHEVSVSLNIEDHMGLKVLEKVFPEIKDLEAVANRTTLRSHMTSGWFISLGHIHDKVPLPLKMFSIDRCFRREQKEDSSHLMTYHSASCVIVDDEVSLDTGMAVSESLLEYFGFSKFKFLPDEKKSKYYIPGTQTEVYGYHPKLKEWIEIATFGLYSPISLAKYGIDKEVMNLGVGAERIAMVLNQKNDIREMVYPQIYATPKFNDRDLATMLHINYYPSTHEGKLLMKKIIDTWTLNATASSPCEFIIHDDDFLGGKIVLKTIEKEDNTNLLGPAATNEIYIHNGNIIGVPIDSNDKTIKETRENGINTNINYIKALAAKAAYQIEEMMVSGQDEIIIKTNIARSISDINLKLDDLGLNHITSNNKEIDIRGPIFSTLICNRK